MNKNIAVVALLFVSLSIVGCTSERYAQRKNDRMMQLDTVLMMKQQDVV
jgi:hypothetical protein